MSELGGEIYAGEEGASGVPEELSEEAKQRFAAAGAAMKQIRKEEKKAKKRDDSVAKAIVQFLGDSKYTHLFVLISRLVGRDCPSIFILAVLSLVHEGSKEEVQNYLGEEGGKTAKEAVDASQAITTSDHINEAMNRELVEWITRMQLVLSHEPQKILMKLMIDEKNIDGSVLQLTTFVVKDFFVVHGKALPFEKIQPLTASILQAVFEPFMKEVKKAFLEAAEKEKDEEDDE